jgi:hypothetical protein
MTTKNFLRNAFNPLVTSKKPHDGPLVVAKVHKIKGKCEKFFAKTRTESPPEHPRTLKTNTLSSFYLRLRAISTALS